MPKRNRGKTTDSTATPKKRVLVLNQFAVPANSAGGTRHVELFSLLTGWTTTFVIGDSNYFTGQKVVTEDDRFKIISLPHLGKGMIGRLIGWTAYATKSICISLSLPKFDVVYASSPHLLSPVAGWVIAKLTHAKLVVEIRDLWPESFVALGAIGRDDFVFKLLSRLEKWVYSRADRIVGVSEEWRSYFRENAPDKPFYSIPNGSDVDFFATAASRSTDIKLGTTNGLRFIFAGAHGPKDGLDLLLDVAGQFPEDRFILVGDGTEKCRLVRRVRDEKLHNVVMLDPVTRYDLPQLLAQADVGLHLVSDWDVFKKGMSPNKLHDYLSAGIPVISNAVGEPHALLKAANGGVGVGAQELLEGIRLMKRVGERQRVLWGKSGQQWMRNNRSREVVARSLGRVLADTGERDLRLPSVTHVTSAHPWTDNRIHHREATSLAQAGYPTSLIAVQREVTEASPTGVSIQLVPHRARLMRMSVGVIQTLFYALRSGSRVLHLHDPELIPWIPVLRIFSRRIIIFDAHEDLENQIEDKSYIPRALVPVAKIAARALVSLSSSAHFVISATPQIADRYSSSNVTVVRNYPTLRPSDSSAPPIQERPLRAVYIGALSDSRGAREMVTAFTDPHTPDGWTLHLAGSWVGERLRREIVGAPGWGRVVDHGIVAPERARELLSTARVGLVALQRTAAYIESLPTKMFEYMSAGLPIIASDFPIWRAILEKYDCGLLIDETSPTSIACAIEKYAQDPDLLSLHSQNARRAAREEFNWRAESEELLGLYNRLNKTSGWRP